MPNFYKRGSYRSRQLQYILTLLILCTQVQLLVAQDQPAMQLNGHNYTVAVVEFSPDNTLIATGSWDSSIKLWDSQTGTLLRTLYGHLFPVFDIAFSADGKYIASCSKDKSIIIWDVQTGKTIHTLTKHSSWVQSISFDHTGKYLVSAGWDSNVYLWNVATGQFIRSFIGHTEYVVSTAFSRDSKIMATGSGDNSIKLWNVSSGSELRTLLGHTNAIWGLDFSHDNKQLISGSQDGTIKKWEVETGLMLFDIKQPEGWVNTVEFSHDDKFFQSASFQVISFWFAENGKFIRSLKQDAGAVLSADFNSDGSKLVSTYKQSAHVWNIGETLFSLLKARITLPFDEKIVYAASSTFDLKIQVESDTIVDQLSALINDSLQYKKEKLRTKTRTDTTFTTTVTFHLTPSENRIKIIADSKIGITKKEFTVIYPFYKSASEQNQGLALLLYDTNDNNLNSKLLELKDLLVASNFDVLIHKNQPAERHPELIADFVRHCPNYSKLLVYYSGNMMKQNGVLQICPTLSDNKKSKPITIDAFIENCTDDRQKLFLFDAQHLTNNDNSTKLILNTLAPNTYMAFINYENQYSENTTSEKRFLEFLIETIRQGNLPINQLIRSIGAKQTEPATLEHTQNIKHIEINTLLNDFYIKK